MNGDPQAQRARRSPRPDTGWGKLWGHVRLYFVAGLVVLAPLTITLVILRFAFFFLDERVGGFVKRLTGLDVPGVGILATAVLILLIGVVTTNVLGARVVQALEAVVLRAPLVNTIYLTVKQVSDLVFKPDGVAFKRAVLIQYPRPGVYSLGFVTGSARRLDPNNPDDEYLIVFVPTSPTPATGFMTVVPTRDVLPLEMSVEEGVKTVVSMGVLMPPRFSAPGPASDDPPRG
ncbi:MAG: DUF502 domain-containing protein [Armatimonadota bacterium]|nr:DUF502 domain-containing protein [Armatimonadota bacterium]MDR5696323.1 DUF502 domain-containing protein [Armatimonadota bacterium]